MQHEFATRILKYMNDTWPTEAIDEKLVDNYVKKLCFQTCLGPRQWSKSLDISSFANIYKNLDSNFISMYYKS